MKRRILASFFIIALCLSACGSNKKTLETSNAQSNDSCNIKKINVYLNDKSKTITSDFEEIATIISEIKSLEEIDENDIELIDGSFLLEVTYSTEDYEEIIINGFYVAISESNTTHYYRSSDELVNKYSNWLTKQM